MNKQSTTKGFAILSVAGIIVKLLSLLYIPFLKEIITLDGYGVYGGAYKIYVWIYVLANSGIPVAISKLVSEYMALGRYKDAVKCFKIARFMMLVLGAVLSLFMFIFAGPLSKAIGFERSKLSIMALAPTVFFTTIVSSYRGYFQGRSNMTPTAKSQIIEQVVNTIFTLVFASMFVKYGVEAGAAGGTLGTSLGSLAAAIFLIIFYEKNKVIRVPKGYVDKSRHTNKQIAKRIIQFGLPLVVCVGLQYSGDIIDLAIVKKRLMVSGLGEVASTEKWALFNMYRTLLAVPITLISALSSSILPSISGSYSVKDKVGVEDKINYAMRFCFLVAVPSAIGLAVLNKAVFLLLFKEEQGGTFLIYGALVLVLNAVVLIQTSILQSIGKLYASTLYIMIGVVGKVVTNYFLVGMPKINIYGAIMGNIVFFTIPLILNYRLITKSLDIKLSLVKHLIKPLESSILMGVIVYGTCLLFKTLLVQISITGYLNNAIATVISVFVGIYTYLYGLALTGGITYKDLEELPPKIINLIPKPILKKIKKGKMKENYVGD